MNLNELNGAQRRQLGKAILSAFTRKDLDQALQHADWQPLDNFLDPGAFDDQVFDLVKWVQMRGRTEKLVAILQEANPDSPRVATLLGDLRLLDIPKPARAAFPGQSLERMVRETAGIADFDAWTSKLLALRRQVCRVEDPTPPGGALGTGFLVARDLVLTNYHVVEDYVTGAKPSAGLRCRFDFSMESGGINTGTLKPLAADWLVDRSPYSAFDTGDQGGLPDAAELDYALLRLATPVGDEPGADGKPRGWLAASQLPPFPAAGDSFFIVQHPKGGPLQLAVGGVTLVNANLTRVRYDANTEGGSSGSPCLNAKLDLVALHHGGDPDMSKLAAFNQGVPLRSILARLTTLPGVPKFWSE